MTSLPIRVAAACCLAWGLSAAAHAADDGAPRPCRVAGLKHEVLCGSVARPLDPAQPDGRTIAVHFVVVPATAREKLPDPVFFFAGGPGQSAIALAGSVLPLFQRLGNRRDIVFIDQRGTGRSAALECERDDARPLAWQLDAERGIQRLADCLQRLRALPHGDLRFYTTTIAMADAEAVRARLGASRVNLVGGSYGTRAALEYLRQFPAQVRRVVIDGVAPPDMALPASMGEDIAAALEQLFADCEREAACHARHPRLREQWRDLLARVPVPASVTDPASGRLVPVTLTRDTLALAVRGPLYAPALAAALPYAIGEAAQGRYSALVGLAGSLGAGSRSLRLAEGMHFAVVCAEDMPRLAGASTGPGLGAALVRPYQAICPSLAPAPVPPEFYAMPPSAAPVLALSGTLDPVTPPRHGARAVQALGPLARHVVVPNAGHGVMAIGCARDLLQRFVDAASDAAALAVDAACLARLPRPPAFEPPRPDAVLPGAAR